MSADLRYIPKVKELVEVVHLPIDSEEGRELLIKILTEKIEPTTYTHEGDAFVKEGKKKKHAEED